MSPIRAFPVLFTRGQLDADEFMGEVGMGAEPVNVTEVDIECEEDTRRAKYSEIRSYQLKVGRI